MEGVLPEVRLEEPDLILPIGSREARSGGPDASSLNGLRSQSPLQGGFLPQGHSARRSPTQLEFVVEEEEDDNDIQAALFNAIIKPVPCRLVPVV